MPGLVTTIFPNCLFILLEVVSDLSLDLSNSDKFDAFEIFKSYLNSKQYSQSMKKDLVTKFFEIQERAKQEKDYA